MIQLTIPGFEAIGPPCKTCATCRELRALSEFYRDRSRRDGLTRECRTCDAARHRRRWRHNRERMRAKARQRYAANIAENRKIGAERRRSERGKAINRLAVKRYQDRNQEKRAAHIAVRSAIRSGILAPAKTCAMTDMGGCSGRVEFHHPDYSKQLDVIPLCVEHHAAAHHKPRVHQVPAPLFEIATGAP